MKNNRHFLLKKLISTVLSIVLVLSVMPFTPFEAKAATHNSGYKFKIVIDVTDDADGWNWAFLYLYTNNDYNGFGSSQKVQEYTITDEIDEGDDVCTKEYDCGYNFPYGITLRTDFGGGFTWREWGADVKLYVNNSLVKTEHVVAKASPFSSSNATHNINIDKSYYPYPEEISVKYHNTDQDDYNFYQGENDEGCNASVSGKAYDQYGVSWRIQGDTTNETYPNNDRYVNPGNVSGDDDALMYYLNSNLGKDHRSLFNLSYSTNNSSIPSMSKSYNIYFHFRYPLTIMKYYGNEEALVGEYSECAGTRFVLPDDTAPTGYHFYERTLTGTGTIDEDENEFIFGEDESEIDYYFSANTYKIHFDGNGADTGKMTDVSCTYDKSKKLTANKFKKENKAFAGWNTEPDGSGDSYDNAATVKNLSVINSDVVTLYAQWAGIPHEVEFEYDEEFVNAIEEYNATVPEEQQISLDTDIVVNQGDNAAVNRTYNINNETKHYQLTSSSESLEDIQEDTRISLVYTLTDHDFDDPVITQHETCTENGVEQQVCKDCGYVKETVRPAAHQGLTTIPKVAPTCTTAGATEGERCAVCNAVTVEPEEIPAEGHDYGDAVWAWADDFSTATATITCSKCGNKESATATLADSEITYEDVELDRVFTASVTINNTVYEGTATQKNLYSEIPYIDENGEEQTLIAAKLKDGNVPDVSALYVADEVTIDEALVLSEDTKLILCDGAKLNISIDNASYEEGGVYSGISSAGNDLMIYGQKFQNGELNISVDEFANQCESFGINCGSYAQYGGKVNVEVSGYGNNYSDGIRANGNIEVRGGELEVTSLNDNALKASGSVSITGGSITATADSAEKAGVYAHSGIELGCTTENSSILVSSFKLDEGQCIVTEGTTISNSDACYSGELDEEDIAAISAKALGPHAYDESVLTEPTCIDAGTAMYTCPICGDSYEGSVPATGIHSYVNDVCTVCGAEREVITINIYNVTSGSIALYPTYYKIKDTVYENHNCADTRYVLTGRNNYCKDILTVNNPDNKEVSYNITFKNVTIKPQTWYSVTHYRGTNTVVNLNLEGTNYVAGYNHSAFKGDATLNIYADCGSNSTITTEHSSVQAAIESSLTLNKVGNYNVKVGENENASLDDAKSARPLELSQTHNWGITGVTEPTCAENGETDYACSNCGRTNAEAIRATLEHNYVDGVCTVCGNEQKTVTLDVDGGKISIYPTYYVYNGQTFENCHWSSTKYIITGTKTRVENELIINNDDNDYITYDVVFRDLTITPNNWCTVVLMNGSNTVVNLNLQGTNSIKASNHGAFKGNATVNISAECGSNTTLSDTNLYKAMPDEIVLNKVGDYNIKVGNNENASLNDAKSDKPLVITKEHNFGEAQWSWNENNEATATVHCDICDEDYTYIATVSEEVLNLKTNYTATVDIQGETYTSPVHTVARTVELWISGTKVDCNNADDILGDNTVSYDEETNTLTLTDATIEIGKYGSIEVGIRYNQSRDVPLNIVLNGKNKLVDNTTNSGTTEKYGICVFAATPSYNISGSGSLEINMPATNEEITYYGIHARKAVSVDAAKVSLNLKGVAPSRGIDLYYGDSIVHVKNGGELDVYTGSGDNAFCMVSNRNVKNLDVEEGSKFIGSSDNMVFGSNINFSDSTKLLKIGVSTVNGVGGLAEWDGNTAIGNFKYVVIPYSDEAADNGSSLTLTDKIETTVYIDTEAYGVNPQTAVVKATYNHNTTGAQQNVKTDIIPLSELEQYEGQTDKYVGTYMFTYACAPAQLTEECTIELYENADAAEPVYTETYSAKSYCDKVNAAYDAADEPDADLTKLNALCNALVDYAKASQNQFNYKKDLTGEYRDDRVQTLTADEIEATANVKTDDVLGFAFDCQDELNILVYTRSAVEPTDVSFNATKYADKISGEAEIKDQTNFIRIKGLGSGNIDKVITVSTENGDITVSANAIAKAYVGANVSSDMKDLARAIYLYGAAAANYFGS